MGEVGGVWGSPLNSDLFRPMNSVELESFTKTPCFLPLSRRGIPFSRIQLGIVNWLKLRVHRSVAAQLGPAACFMSDKASTGGDVPFQHGSTEFFSYVHGFFNSSWGERGICKSLQYARRRCLHDAEAPRNISPTSGCFKL
jgi:hypothetical protein